MTIAKKFASDDSVGMTISPPPKTAPKVRLDAIKPPTANNLAPSGQLSLMQRWHLTLAVLSERLGNTLRSRPRSAQGPHQLPKDMTDDLLRPALWRSLQAPKSALAQMVWQYTRVRQPEWLNNHCLRTFAWAQAVGHIGGIKADADLLFAAAALHDIGLTPSASEPTTYCFAMRGATHARQLLAPSLPTEQVETVSKAIAHHLDFRVGLDDAGAEAHLLQAGAMIDVLGKGISHVPRAVREQILIEYPRLHMKRELCQCIRQQVAGAPNSRMGLYVGRFGFLKLIARAPFDE